MTDGSARCWGLNSFGTLGDGTQTKRNTPVEVKFLTHAREISVSKTFVCATLKDGTAKCWGLNVYGELGDGTSASSTKPVFVSDLKNALQISTGGRHSCAVLGDGSARCWGSGFLGDGPPKKRLKPVRVNGLTHAKEIFSGSPISTQSGNNTCALLGDGTVRCWGHNKYGQLGDGSKADSPVPVPVQF